MAQDVMSEGVDALGERINPTPTQLIIWEGEAARSGWAGRASPINRYKNLQKMQ